jgi:hypothetical protein
MAQPRRISKLDLINERDAALLPQDFDHMTEGQLAEYFATSEEPDTNALALLRLHVNGEQGRSAERSFVRRCRAEGLVVFRVPHARSSPPILRVAATTGMRVVAAPTTIWMQCRSR